MTSPTPAAVKVAPRIERSVGSITKGPTISNMRLESSKKSLGVLTPGRIAKRIPQPTKTPTVKPTRVEIFGKKKANRSAKTPILNDARKILFPTLVYARDISSSVGFITSSPRPTCLNTAGSSITIRPTPVHSEGIHLPTIKRRPSMVQNTPVPMRFLLVLSRKFEMPA